MKFIFIVLAFSVSVQAGFLFSKPADISTLCVPTGKFRCHCPLDDTVTLLDCAERNIKELPAGLVFPDYLVEVTFQKNNIKDIPNTIFLEGLSVGHLDLSQNMISYVASDAFAGFENLKQLDLSHNEIWSLSVDVFHGLRYLSSLNLAYNKISYFLPDVFKGYENLQDVNLKYNPMLSVDSNTFSYLHEVRTLDLSSTGLADLPLTAFSNNSQLINLLLIANAFNAVPTRSIKSAKNLRLLDISENPIQKIASKSFLGLAGLEYLRIMHMRNLHALDKYSLTGLDNLKELYIANCPRLTRISPLAFKRLPKLKVEGADSDESDSEEDEKSPNPFLTKLSLRHNSLQSIPEDLMDWEKLSDLDLRENPWACDCHLSWVAKKPIAKITKEGAVCASPKRLAGRTQSSLVASDYTCSYLSSEATVSLAVIVVAAFALALVGIGFLLYKRSLIRCGRKRQTEPKYTRVVSTKEKVEMEWDHTGEPPSSTEA